MKVSRRRLIGGAASGAFAPLGECRAAKMAAGFAAPITAIPFGAVSHWLQPWRALCQARKVDDIENGIGVVIDGFAVPQDALGMLRRQGFRHARTEIRWSLVDPETEDRFINQAEITGFLGRLLQAGLRPLILLNAYDGNPCPFVRFTVQLAQDAAAGARSVTLVSTAGLVPGRSGFARLGKLPAACPLATEIDGQRVSLSMPLAAAIPAGAVIEFVTLNYQPFSQPGSPGNERTIAGWLRYVDLVCETATAALGRGNAADRGFDLEIWNELTFGSRFLAINNYYDPKLLDYNPRLLWSELVRRTAAHIDQAGTKYLNVVLTDGFASTIPWPAAATEPARINAISKHPYPPHLQFPASQKANAVGLDAFGQKTDFVPSYKCYFPESLASVIQTESICRDLGNENDRFCGATHGRRARIVSGRVSPVDVWITEIGCNPWEMGDLGAAVFNRQIVAFVARSLFFHLGIGAGRVYLFEAFGGPGSFGLVDQATQATPSLALLTISRMLAAIRGNGNAAPAGGVAPIVATALRGPADTTLFAGNGTPNLPDMTSADSLVLLPVQAAKNRIALIYYIMTRDIRVPLDPQKIRVRVQAAGIENFDVNGYDPFSETEFGVDNQRGFQDRVELELAATDIPRVVIFSTAI